MEKINESKSLFFEKINSQTDQKRTEKTKLPNIRILKADITTDSTDT